MIRVVALACLLVCLMTTTGEPAALPVIDVGAIAQLALNVAEVMKLVGLEVRDLAVLANVGPLTAMGEHLIVLMEQLENERQLIIEIAQLWGLLEEERPEEICTVEARRDWLYQAVHLNRRRIAGTITLTLALVKQTGAIIQTLVQMAGLWAVITGSVAGLQVIAAMQARANGYLQAIHDALTSEKMAKASQEIVEITDVIMTDCILGATMADWGTVAPR